MLKHLFDIPEEIEYNHSGPTTPENYIAQYVINDWEMYNEREKESWELIKTRLRA